MSSYFRWIKSGSKKDLDLYDKPRSRSLDAKSLELSGLRLVVQTVCRIILKFKFYNS